MAQKKMPPCYECDHRSPGCACNAYKDWKNDYLTAKAAIRNKQSADGTFLGYKKDLRNIRLKRINKREVHGQV